MSGKLSELLTTLTGKKPPFPGDWDEAASRLLEGNGIGLSQLNELLLLLGYDRMSAHIFSYIRSEQQEECGDNTICSLDQLEAGIKRFQKLAILLYGSTRYAYNFLNENDKEYFDSIINKLKPYDDGEYKSRHLPLLPVDEISGEDTYYLGYIVGASIKNKLETNPSDATALIEQQKRNELIEKAKRNQQAYLASDHMDVYVATSMREKHEYLEINRIVKEVFRPLSDLNIRFFDPTQAYCEDRIDKGLAEALMLKRAECTLYLAQESDTLGKDSELASTLAQGKPVIAYIPEITDDRLIAYVNDVIEKVKSTQPCESIQAIILKQLQIFNPKLAWSDKKVMNWILNPDEMDTEAAKILLGSTIKSHYDKRAKILQSDHPLGIQVGLDTGLANGVLVARTTDQCSQLIRGILTNTLEFYVEPKPVNGKPYMLLKDTITHSVYRVITGDEFLTNAFWNYYLL